MKALSLDRQIDRLAQHVIRARLFLDLWFYFEEHDSRTKIFDTMDKYSDFFRFAPHAYFVAHVVYIAGVFEQRNDTINFGAIARRAQDDGRFDETKFVALRTAAAPIAKKAIILRHNAVAHRTNRMSYDEVFDLAKITPAELRELTDSALELCNLLLAARGLPAQYFNPLPKQAAEQMMAALGQMRESRP
jgi:hypothetical protein